MRLIKKIISAEEKLSHMCSRYNVEFKHHMINILQNNENSEKIPFLDTTQRGGNLFSQGNIKNGVL